MDPANFENDRLVKRQSVIAAIFADENANR